MANQTDYIELIPPKRQRTWGWPAVANLILGGAGSGLYLIGTLVNFCGDKWLVEVQRIPFQILAIILVCCGFLSVAIEAGRPMRVYRLAANLDRSWMSIESISGVIFMIVGVGAFIFPSFFLDATAFLAALVFITSQGMLVFHAKAMGSWNRSFAPVLFITSGFVTASGLILLLTLGYPQLSTTLMVIIVLFTILNLFIWVRYRWSLEAYSKKIVTFIGYTISILVIVITGHLIPIFFIFTVYFIVSTKNAATCPVVLQIFSGVMLITVGAIQKVGVIIASGYFRPIVLKKEKG